MADSAEKFFCRPPPPKKKLRNLGGTAGDSLSLGTKCWLSVGHFMAPCRLDCLFGIAAYFVSLDLN